MTVEIKICGITCLADAQAAVSCGVTYLGFNFWQGSVRYVTPEVAAEIVSGLNHACQAVGVFVNEQRSCVEAIAGSVGLDVVQLHGDEDSAAFAGFPLPVWRAVRPGEGDMAALLEGWRAERILVDANVQGHYGGTGDLADWQAAAALARSHAVMLAGGLTPANVGEAIRAVRPRGVDTAGGVESGPGKKDHDKIRRFVLAVREAEASCGG